MPSTVGLLFIPSAEPILKVPELLKVKVPKPAMAPVPASNIPSIVLFVVTVAVNVPKDNVAPFATVRLLHTLILPSKDFIPEPEIARFLYPLEGDSTV
ncbi:hypothetical protein Q0590_35615 [Rhodocytophaga aerolata]|uniref:Uncharacterized protein n=1 Tax=Rhodocytophaga aerolata TaxID=455078 RepID=A0ABT8RHS8_9BACT|nr:hypothetical protein [Rhodocytophaga aerolata]MDO1451656.1 hypothetical protein [Rhodocytophaga aerolata]